MSVNNLILLSLLVPTLTALLVVLAGRRDNLREAMTLSGAGLLCLSIFTLYGRFNGEQTELLTLIEPIPGLSIAFSIEPLGLLFSMIASCLWLVTSIYAIGYMRGNKEQNQTRFYFCFAVAIAATIGIAFSANLLTLFLFYEVLTLSTWPLVTHSQSDKARKAGRVYLGILLTASFAFFLPAIVWTWVLAADIQFTEGGVFDTMPSTTVMFLLLALYVFGIAKAAVMPLHAWLPAAMVAPTPVSALLHAVAVVKAGVFSIVKIIVYIFGQQTLTAAGITEFFVYIAGLTIVLASAIALYQDNLKRRLAFSTISQLSYVVMAALLVAPISIIAAALHIAVHAFGKITLFFAAGAIYTAHHKTEISQLNGIGRQMPWTMTAFAIASLSMIGVPPIAGFLSKWYLLNGAIVMENLFVIAVLLISTLLNAAYFLPIVYAAFFKTGEQSEYKEASLNMVIPIIFTATMCLIMFFQPQTVLNLVNRIPY